MRFRALAPPVRRAGAQAQAAGHSFAGMLFFFQAGQLLGAMGGCCGASPANGCIAKVYGLHEGVPPFDGNDILLPYGPGGIPYLMPTLPAMQRSVENTEKTADARCEKTFFAPCILFLPQCVIQGEGE